METRSSVNEGKPKEGKSLEKGDIVQQMTDLTNKAETLDELHDTLSEMAYAIGGMVCYFPQEVRSQVCIKLTEVVGMGLMFTSKDLGDECDIQMVVGNTPEGGATHGKTD